MTSSAPKQKLATMLPVAPWALDSCMHELDSKLRAAHEFSLKEPDHQNWADADRTEPILLRDLLSIEHIQEILAATSADGVWPRGVAYRNRARADPVDPSRTVPPSIQHRFSDCLPDIDMQAFSQPLSSPLLSLELRSVPHRLAWSDEHVVLYMHMNDWFVKALPTPWSIIRGAMEYQPWTGGVPILADDWIGSSQSMADVRCIELHHYSEGGGLTDAGHRDCGSALTMSILLSDSEDVTGGDFVTYSNGAPIAHKMALGDAILFHSEKLHNISTVQDGLRKSLVVELWPSKRY